MIKYEYDVLYLYEYHQRISYEYEYHVLFVYKKQKEGLSPILNQPTNQLNGPVQTVGRRVLSVGPESYGANDEL